MDILNFIIDLHGLLPDEVRIPDSGSPAWTVLRMMAFITGRPLFEDASFGQ